MKIKDLIKLLEEQNNESDIQIRIENDSFGTFAPFQAVDVKKIKTVERVNNEFVIISC